MLMLQFQFTVKPACYIGRILPEAWVILTDLIIFQKQVPKSKKYIHPYVISKKSKSTFRES